MDLSNPDGRGEMTIEDGGSGIDFEGEISVKVSQIWEAVDQDRSRG